MASNLGSLESLERIGLSIDSLFSFLFYLSRLSASWLTSMSLFWRSLTYASILILSFLNVLNFSFRFLYLLSSSLYFRYSSTLLVILENEGNWVNLSIFSSKFRFCSFKSSISSPEMDKFLIFVSSLRI